MNMKNILAGAIALGLAPFATASFAAEDTATASATVFQPIAIAVDTHLEFGEFAAGSGGTVTVNTAGARSGNGVILSSTNSNPTAARFDVTGQADATYEITVAADATLVAGEDSMALAVAYDLIGDGTEDNPETGLLTSGAQSIYVGGTLTVGDTQVAGAYSGEITVTVEYN